MIRVHEALRVVLSFENGIDYARIGAREQEMKVRDLVDLREAIGKYVAFDCEKNSDRDEACWGLVSKVGKVGKVGSSPIKDVFIVSNMVVRHGCSAMGSDKFSIASDTSDTRRFHDDRILYVEKIQDAILFDFGKLEDGQKLSEEVENELFTLVLGQGNNRASKALELGLGESAKELLRRSLALSDNIGSDVEDGVTINES